MYVSALFGSAACGSQKAIAPPLTAQASGSLAVAGLSAPVRIVRDRWGVPHIYARNRDDVFAAQGFVQAPTGLPGRASQTPAR